MNQLDYWNRLTLNLMSSLFYVRMETRRINRLTHFNSLLSHCEKTHVLICWSVLNGIVIPLYILTSSLSRNNYFHYLLTWLLFWILNNCFGLKMEKNVLHGDLKYLVMSTLSDIQWISERSTGPTHIYREKLKLDNLSFKKLRALIDVE